MALTGKFQRKLANRAREEFVMLFPKAFAPKGAPKRPLKVGIFRDVYDACDLTFLTIKLALGDYCGGPSYQTCLIEGAPRIALDGSVAGYVTKNEAEHAAEIFAQFPEHIRLRWRPETKGPTEPGSSTGPVGQSLEGSTL